MSAAIRTIELPAGEATYDSDMPMGVLRKMLGASEEGDLGGLVEAMTGIVQTWPYEGDPSNVEDWDSLRRSEFNGLIKGVVTDLGELGEE